MSHQIPSDVALAMAVHSMKGIYAFLLGSGVSSAAGIPTGWEILLDLIRKVGAAHGKDCEPDPAKWHEETYGHAPNYSDLLEDLAGCNTERQQLLRTYFEPDDEERERGLKQPTAAHRAIADLIARGYVRVVITTNFDRLMEKALDDVGVVPTVIARPEDLDGAMPLTHSRCTIVKPNGDYMDARIRNTPEELSNYDAEIADLLKRILNEFGLIVCGLSADYDKALVDLLIRYPNTKFSSFWTARSQLGVNAKSVVEARRARVIEIQNANQFFGDLKERVNALGDLLSQEEITAKIAGQRVRRILTERESKIKLHEIVYRQTEVLHASLFNDSLPSMNDLESNELLDEIKRLEEETSVLLSMLVEGCYWDEEQEYTEIWVKCIERLANPPVTESQYVQYSELRWYPVVLSLYAAGISAVAHGNYETLLRLVVEPVAYDLNEEKPVFFEIAYQFARFDALLKKKIADFENRDTPLAHLVFECLRAPLERFLHRREEYARCFARFEFISALEIAHKRRELEGDNARIYGHNGYWTWGKIRGRFIINEIHNEASNKGKHWLPLTAGFLNGDPKEYSLIAVKLMNQRIE